MSDIFTYKKIYKAYLFCRQNKRKTESALNFELNLEKNLKELLEEIIKGYYMPRKSICFVVTAPKPREIFAADFRDRIVHHLMVGEVEDFFEKRFIFDSYACRKNKGTHRAVARLYYFLKKRENQKAWFLKLDIKSFFISIEHQILYDIIEKKIKKMKLSPSESEALLKLIKVIIFHNPTNNYIIKGQQKLYDLIPRHKSLLNQKDGKGLPIGNHSSQFFANVYMNELDQYIKRVLKCQQYIRYVDDFILISQDRADLPRWKRQIESFLKKELKLDLSESKTIIQPVKRGIDFLGYFVRTDAIYPRRKLLKKYRDKMYKIAIGLHETEWIYLKSMHASYCGHFNFKGKFFSLIL